MCERTPRLERWRHRLSEVARLVDELVDLVAAVTRLAVQCRRLGFVVAPFVAALLAALR